MQCEKKGRESRPKILLECRASACRVQMICGFVQGGEINKADSMMMMMMAACVHHHDLVNRSSFESHNLNCSNILWSLNSLTAEDLMEAKK